MGFQHWVDQHEVDRLPHHTDNDDPFMYVTQRAARPMPGAAYMVQHILSKSGETGVKGFYRVAFARARIRW